MHTHAHICTCSFTCRCGHVCLRPPWLWSTLALPSNRSVCGGIWTFNCGTRQCMALVPGIQSVDVWLIHVNSSCLQWVARLSLAFSWHPVPGIALVWPGVRTNTASLSLVMAWHCAPLCGFLLVSQQHCIHALDQPNLDLNPVDIYFWVLEFQNTPHWQMVVWQQIDVVEVWSSELAVCWSLTWGVPITL